MTTAADVVQIIISAEDRASATLRGVGDAVSGLSDGVGRVTGPLATLTDSILKVDTAAAALGAAFVGLSLRETVQFQDSLFLVKKQLGESGVSIDDARAKIEGLGLTYGTNANDVAKSMAGFLAAGNDYVNSAGLVETATKLMIAGELDATFATDAITKSLAGFRVPAADAATAATKVGDVLNKIGDISSGNFEEIVTGFTRLAPTAKDAGLSMEETAAMVAVLVDKFGSGEIAATALKAGFVTLLDPSKEAKTRLQELGIAMTDASGTLRPAKTIMDDLSKAIAAQTDTQRLQTAAVIFGKDQAGAMNALLGDWAKNQEYVAQMMDKTTGAAGSMDKEVRGKLDLISASVATAVEAWRQFVERFGARLTVDGDVKSLSDSVGKLGIAFKAVVDAGGLDPLIDGLKAQAATISTVVERVAANLPAAFAKLDFSGVLGAFGALGTAVGTVFDGIDLRTPEGLTKALQAIVDTGGTLIRITAGIVDGIKPAIRWLADMASEINGADEETKRLAGEFLGWAKVINEILPALAWLGGGLSAVGTGLASLGAASALRTLAGLGEGAAATAAALAGKMGLVGAAGAAGYAVGTVLADGVDAGISKITGTSTSLGSWIYDLVNGTEQIEARAAPTAAALVKTGDAAQSAGKGIAEAKAPIDALAAGQRGLITASELMGNALLAGVVKTDKLAESTGAVVKVYDQAGNAVEKTKLATGQLVSVLRDSQGNIVGYGDALGGTVAKLDKTAEATAKAAKESDTYRIKIAEIDAELEKAKLEAFVTIRTTELETDAARVKETFDSIDNSVTSTSDLIGSLFDSLAKAGTLRDKWDIAAQIELENKRRQEALDLQKELANAEIERIREQTKALARGDALIQIDGTGLEPELEAFMWQILKRIRVRANAEFSDYLLGMGA